MDRLLLIFRSRRLLLILKASDIRMHPALALELALALALALPKMHILLT
jgi:hypothetical protein